jgi:hypothetical protein
MGRLKSDQAQLLYEFHFERRGSRSSSGAEGYRPRNSGTKEADMIVPVDRLEIAVMVETLSIAFRLIQSMWKQSLAEPGGAG